MARGQSDLEALHESPVRRSAEFEDGASVLKQLQRILDERSAAGRCQPSRHAPRRRRESRGSSLLSLTTISALFLHATKISDWISLTQEHAQPC